MSVVHPKDSVVVIQTLFHVAIKKRDIRATRCFYLEVLGVTVDTGPEIHFALGRRK